MHGIHERALLENEAFDILLPWKIFHPRTFFDMVSAVADRLAATKKQPETNLAELMHIGTGTTNAVIMHDWQIVG